MEYVFYNCFDFEIFIFTSVVPRGSVLVPFFFYLNNFFTNNIKAFLMSQL